MKSRRLARFILFAIILAPLAIFLFGSLVMLLWNNVASPVLHLSTVTFWQALGILVLSKILFSSFSGRGGGPGRYQWRKRIMRNWKDMTPEEKEKFKEQWRDHCGRWGYKPWDSEGPSSTQTTPTP
jgi:hypothetical protein